MMCRFFVFQAEDGIRGAHYRLEFRGVLFRAPVASHAGRSRGCRNRPAAERERTLMGQISLRVGERSHMMSCRDGEEEHLLRLDAMIDRTCNEATTELGVMLETRRLLTAALLIADEQAEQKNGVAAH